MPFISVRDGERKKSTIVRAIPSSSVCWKIPEPLTPLAIQNQFKTIAFLYDRLYRIIKIIILFAYSNGRKTKPKQKSKMKWIVTRIRYIQVYCLFFSFDCCCKGVITFSCLPGSSQRMLPLLQYFNFHGVKAAAAGYVYFCRYVCVHRLPTARRKKNCKKKKKREPST